MFCPKLMLGNYLSSFMEIAGAAATEHAQKETTVTDSSDVAADVSADCLSKDEVVNCICQLNEENGLMIQVGTNRDGDVEVPLLFCIKGVI